MAVLNALRQTPRALQRNPVLFVPVLAIVLFQIPQVALQTISPLVASVVSLALSLLFVFVLPFFQAGIVGMADEALDGRTSIGRFVGAGKEHYVSMLVAYLVVVAVNFVLGLAAFFVALPVGFAFLGDFGGVGVVVLAIVAVVGALVVLGYLLFAFFVQFYGQAIVLDGLGPVDGLKHSVSVVRHHLVSTLGYTVLVGVVGGVAGGVFGVASILVSPRSSAALALPHLSVAASVGVAFLLVVFGTLFGGFFAVYSVSFYRTLTRPAGATSA